MKDVIKRISSNISTARLYESVKAITNFHRIQASPGFNKAAHYLCKELQNYGLEAKVHEYPADGDSFALSCKLFKEWACNGAILRDGDGKVWADFSAEPISIIQKSYSADFSEEGLELVYLPTVENYTYPHDVELRDKLVFYRGRVSDICHWAIGEKGARGFVTDFVPLEEGVRDRKDMYDSKAYTSFWWPHDAYDTPAFGFVLSPRQGDELMRRIEHQASLHIADAREPAYIKMYGRVNAEIYKGTIDVVEAKIPGKTDEEILLTAHLCHPQPSANDNASGVAAVSEALRVLRQMIDYGQIDCPQRGITAIFIPEYTGIYTYLAERKSDLSMIRAGLNLDMVGGKQGDGYGPVTLSDIPDTSYSFVTSLAELILDYVFADIPTHSAVDMVSTFMRSSTEFDPGSDNYILSDPTINIPTPMFGQWPDRNYHTSTDNLDCIDPALLKKSASLAASYAYILANLSLNDVQPILEKAFVRFQKRAIRQLNILPSAVGAGRPAKLENTQADKVYLFNIFAQRTASLVSYFSGEDQEVVRNWVSEIQKQATTYLKIFPEIQERCPLSEDCYDEVWVRNYIAPTTRIVDFFNGRPELYDLYQRYLQNIRSKTHNAYRIEAIAQFELTTGKSLGKILQDLERQFPQERQELEQCFLGYFELLKVLKLVDKC